MDKKISELDVANPLTGAEEIAISQGGETRRVTLTDLVSQLSVPTPPVYGDTGVLWAWQDGTGWMKFPFSRTFTVNMTLDGTESSTKFVFQGQGASTLTLPEASTVDDTYYVVVENGSPSGAVCYIAVQGGDTLNGSTNTLNLGTGQVLVIHKDDGTTNYTAEYR